MPKREKEMKQMAAFVTKMNGDEGIVEAIVSVMGIVDDGNDIIEYGAYTKTLTERGRKVRVLNSHAHWSTTDVIGMPLAMREIPREELPQELLDRFPDATGALWTQTQYLMDTQAGRETFARIKAGAVDEYSIGYEAMQFEYITDENDRTIRVIKEIRLWEYSPVVWGMNPATMTTGVKGDSARLQIAAYLQNVKSMPLDEVQPLTDEPIELPMPLIQKMGINVIEVDGTDRLRNDDALDDDDRAEPEESTHAGANEPAAGKMALERARLNKLIEIGLAMEAQ